jgi:hypothetical protein
MKSTEIMEVNHQKIYISYSDWRVLDVPIERKMETAISGIEFQLLFQQVILPTDVQLQQSSQFI